MNPRKKEDLMRNMLVAALAFGMALAFSVTANAGALEQGWSFLDIKLGAIPQIRLGAQSTDITLVDTGPGTHGILENASVFQTDSYTLQSAAFTGLPALTGLKLSLHAGSGAFADNQTYANPVGTGVVSGFGGTEANSGSATLSGGGFSFAISLSVIGNGAFGGMTTLAPVLQNTLVLTGAPFNTGAVNITGLSSNIVSHPIKGTGVAFTLNLTTVELITATTLTAAGVPLVNNTVVIGGTNNLASASQAGTIKMVSPFRLRTGGLAGNVAGSVTKTFTFVPEPGTVLLLVTGAAGLAIVGRKRMRK
jgi:hypothetical protein